MELFESFNQETKLITQYGANAAFIVWAMGLYLNESDLAQLAIDCLTDAGDDKKIDFLKIDDDNNILYVVQGYFTSKSKECAPANKASDLNCASAWLTNGDITKLQPSLQELVREVREKIIDGTINTIELVYVHNCPETKQVHDELETAALTLKNCLQDNHVDVQYRELGITSLQRIYYNQVANIIVNDKIECPFRVQYEENSDDWKAAIMTISGDWLRSLYAQYKNDLFSANYRGYLGQGRKKINVGIKNSAEKESGHFWAYNNGITILTTDYEDNGNKTILHGISIINGAQTTGTIANIPTDIPLSDVKILTRIIACATPTLIGAIVKFNNTQNRITAWDGYSNDPKQVAIRDQFRELGYEYNFKRGFENRDSVLSVENSIQPLIAFNGKYKDANRSKTAVFESNTLYSEAFENAKVRHILFVYCLNAGLQKIKAENKKLVLTPGSVISETDKLIFDMFSPIKSKNWILALLGELLPKLYSHLLAKGEISLTPEFSKNEQHPIGDVVDLMSPMLTLIISQAASIIKEKGGFLASYDNSTMLPYICADVEARIAAVRSSVSGVNEMYISFGRMICNG